MISALLWVRKGATAEKPEKYELDDKEYDRISKLTAAQLEISKSELESHEAETINVKSDPELESHEVKMTDVKSDPELESHEVKMVDENSDPELLEYNLEQYDEEDEEEEGQ
ncbi:6707_t:CDS:2, partial [Dentiscutata erythropus]